MQKQKSYRLLRAFFAIAVMMCGGILSAENNEKTFSVVKNGKPEATIVVADKPGNLDFLNWTTEDAAKFLQEYIRKSTGAELPVCKESQIPAQGSLILVGKTKIGDSAGISGEKLPLEGYEIKTFNRGVAIVGEVSDKGDQGTLFGIYRLLEDTLGIRWYFPGEMGTVIPENKDMSVKADYSVVAHPYFPYRIGGVGHWSKSETQNWHPALRFGRGKGMNSNHSMESWGKLYGKTHPEYFGLKKDGTRAITTDRAKSGQNRSFMCFSDPGMLKQSIDNVDAYFNKGDVTPWRGSAMPKGNNIPFGPHDTREYCQCEKCKSMVTTGKDRWKWGETSDLIFDFVKKYAEGVKEKHPEAVIWVLAYDHFQLPPLKIKHLPDNVGVTLCPIPTVVQMNHPGVRERNRKIIDQWFEIVNRNPDRLVIWDYFCYPNCFFLAPTELPHVLKEHVNFLKGKALGIFNNGFNPTRKEKSTRMNLTLRMVWLMHQLLWNPDLDLDKARKDWCCDLFGPGGKTMEEFYRLLEDRWEKVVWETQPELGYVSEYGIYFETYPAEVVTKLERLYETAINETKPGSIYRKRLEFFKEDAFEPFFEIAREYHAATGAVQKYKVNEFTVPPMKNGEMYPDAWQKLTSIKTVDRITGKTVDESTKIKVAYDKQNLYIYADMELPKAEGKIDNAKKEREDTAEFQFGAGKGSNKVSGNLVNAKAEGRENPKVNLDDMFIIYLKPAAAKGYTELAINMKGSFTSRTDIIRERGFFPTHELEKMDTTNVKIISKLSGDNCLLSVEIPWKALPGVKEIPPEEMQAQFIRWNVKDKHNFNCWSPTLSSWDFPLSRFGWLIFKEVGKTEAKVVRPDKLQIGYSSAVGPKTEQPKNINKAKIGETIIVGQREIKENWIEFRGELIFPLTDIKTPQQIYRAILNITLVNVLGSEPYDAVVVDHIVPAEPNKISEADYFAPPIGGKPVGPILAKGFSRGRSMIKRTLSIDITNCVKDDIQKGRKVSAYRLRIADGCVKVDGDNHSFVFNGSTTDEIGPVLTLQMLAK